MILSSRNSFYITEELPWIVGDEFGGGQVDGVVVRLRGDVGEALHGAAKVRDAHREQAPDPAAKWDIMAKLCCRQENLVT